MATKITTAAQLATAAVDVAKNYKTLYVMGCFGAPMNSANKTRYCKNHEYNTSAKRTAMIKAATADTFGFDCVCLIKGLLWGWNGDKSKTYGGATYACNGVPDIGADAMIKVCKEVSTDFSNIEIGEAVWTDGHIGIYVGDGLAVECTPAWKNKVQITACNCSKSGYNRRDWKKHGKLPYVKYTGKDENVPSKKPNTGSTTKTKNQLTVDGKWGSSTTTRLQKIFGTPVDGVVSNQWAKFKDDNPGLVNGWDWEAKPNGKGSDLIKAMQKWAGMASNDRDGEIGPKTIKAFQRKLGTTVDGVVSYPSEMVKALQKWANKQ